MAGQSSFKKWGPVNNYEELIQELKCQNDILLVNNCNAL